MPTLVQYNRVKLLSEKWKEVKPKTVCLSTYKCGTLACLVGHAAQMDEFNQEGLYPNSSGLPVHGAFDGIDACLEFFGDFDILFAGRTDGSWDAAILEKHNGNLNDHQLASERMAEWLKFWDGRVD